MTTSVAPAIAFEGVGKAYAGRHAVDGLSLSITAGRITTLIGPSGCGKTTLLRMVNALVAPDAGRVLVGGQDVQSLDPVALRRRIGYVIQQIGLFPHLTVAQNVALVPSISGAPAAATHGRVQELLDLINLPPGDFAKRYPHELSGGQQQRVGIARALAADPDVVLMDEPFSALDPISRVQLQDEVTRLNRQLRKTFVIVTHDVDEALKISDQVAVLHGGRLAQWGTPAQLLAHPADAFVAGYLAGVRRGAAAWLAADLLDASAVATATAAAAGDVLVPHDLPLALLLTRLDAAGATGIAITGADGTVLGRLERAAVLGRLARLLAP